VNRFGVRDKMRLRLLNTPLWLFILYLSFIPGCELPGKPKLAAKPIAADKVVDFNVLYSQNCAGCHGADGRLGPAPPLNDAIFLAIVPDRVLASVIANGRPGTPMPAFAKGSGGPLTNVQIEALAVGIKPRWSVPEKSHDRAPPYIAASRAAIGNKAQGARVFVSACAPCHGPLGEGGEADKGGAGAICNPVFLALISDQALRRYAITGRPDLGMPSYADKTGRSENYQPMTSEAIEDLVAFLASWRQGDRQVSAVSITRMPGIARAHNRSQKTSTVLSIGQ
jgi:cytochrome c oxidase cbb3-type subunit III